MNFRKWGIINAQTNSLGAAIGSAIVILLFMQPILFFSVGGATTQIAITTYFACLIALIFDKTTPHCKPKNSIIYWWIIFSLSSFIIATGLSQIANQSFTPNRLDSPLRLLLSGLVFYSIYRYKISFLRLLQISIPLSIGIFLLHILLRPDQIVLGKSMWHGRVALPFIDPILLSAWLTCFGLICLSLVNLEASIKKMFLNIILILTFVTSIYIALLTESRNSWLAIPLLIGVFIFRQSNKLTKFIFFLITILIIIFLINAVSSSFNRIDLALIEFKNYFNRSAIETSVGIRIELGALAFKALSIKPFFGWSEKLFSDPSISDYLKNNYTNSTLFLGQYAGFHSDFYAAIVRSGLLGAIAYIATFFTPLVIFVIVIKRGNQRSKSAAYTGLAIILTCLIASVTVEILAYKYSVSLFGYLIAGLMAQCLWENN